MLNFILGCGRRQRGLGKDSCPVANEEAPAAVLGCQMTVDEACSQISAAALTSPMCQAPASVPRMTSDDPCSRFLVASTPASITEAPTAAPADQSDAVDTCLELQAVPLIAAADGSPTAEPHIQAAVDGASSQIRALSLPMPGRDTSAAMLDCSMTADGTSLHAQTLALPAPTEGAPTAVLDGQMSTGSTCFQLALADCPKAATACSAKTPLSDGGAYEQARRALSRPERKAGYAVEVPQAVFQQLTSNLHTQTKMSASDKTDGKVLAGVSDGNTSMALSQQVSHGARSRRATLSSYKALGASPEDTAHDLKRKYRQQLLQKHPDKGGTKEDFLEVQRSLDYVAARRKSVAMLFGMSRPNDEDDDETMEVVPSCLAEEPKGGESMLAHQRHDDKTGVVSATDVAKVALPVAKRRRQARSCGS
eukprot:TRINITY_DN75466_c0_g1_i1.p1 TRINITY_DN75466_c0_g1~~TRINITY_DN75466_c0_g1_i1.p1  ORF type:complete len:422 (-),score=91.90 TRINITY_DN75466_c0_g1_i1:265-1530(-)